MSLKATEPNLANYLEHINMSAGPVSELFDLIQIFVTSKIDLETQLPKLKINLNTKRLLWVTDPRAQRKLKPT